MAKKPEKDTEATSTDAAASTDQSTTNSIRTLICKAAVVGGSTNLVDQGNLVDSGSNGYYATFPPSYAYAIVRLCSTISTPNVTGQLWVRGGPATLTISTSSSSSGSWAQQYSSSFNNSGGQWVYFSLPVGTYYIKIETSGSYNMYVD